MDLMCQKGKESIDYFKENHDIFEDMLLTEAVNVKDKIEEIRRIGNINLVDNAHKLVMHVILQEEEKLIEFAAIEGKIWATNDLTLSFKLEWVQAIRRTLWAFLKIFDEQSGNELNKNTDFYELEKRINDRVDQFLNTFFISYSKYKDELIRDQQELVNKLSVPVIPITKETAILPLIGKVSPERATIIEEKALIEVNRLQVQTLIIDLSGIAEMEMRVIDHLMKTIQGISIMGCNAVLTGIRPEIVRKIVKLGVNLNGLVQTKASLQQALQDYLIVK